MRGDSPPELGLGFLHGADDVRSRERPETNESYFPRRLQGCHQRGKFRLIDQQSRVCRR